MIRRARRTTKKETQGLLFGLSQVSPVDDYLAVYAALMIPTTVPSAIVLSTDNDRSAFTVDPSKTAVVVAMANPHVDILCECGECDAQSHNRRKNQKPTPHCQSPLEFMPLRKPTCTGLMQRHPESSSRLAELLVASLAQNVSSTSRISSAPGLIVSPN